MKAFVAEFVATFVLVFLGTGAIVLSDAGYAWVGQFEIALAFGGAVALMIIVFGRISGAHMNPAVTVALAFGDKFPWKNVLPYVIMQVAGGVLASVVLCLSFPENEYLGTTLPSGSVMESFWLEFGLTFILMLGVIYVGTIKRYAWLLAALIVGGIVGLEAYFAGPICGASMNPARSLAPALVSGHLEHLWLYLVATTLGALTIVGIVRMAKR